MAGKVVIEASAKHTATVSRFVVIYATAIAIDLEKMMTRLLISVIRSSSFTDWETRGKKPFTACHCPHLHIVKSHFIFGTQARMGFDTC